MSGRPHRPYPFAGYAQMAVGRLPWATARIYHVPGYTGRSVIFFMSAKVGTAPVRNLIRRRCKVAWSCATATGVSSVPLAILLIPRRTDPTPSYHTISQDLAHLVIQAAGRCAHRAHTPATPAIGPV